jgi:hypothetical protein
MFKRSHSKDVKWVEKAYQQYTKHKQTYAELSVVYDKTPKTLRKYFDAYAGATGEMTPLSSPTVLILDATFFGRGYGILLCRSPQSCLYWREIISESMDEYGQCLEALDAMEYRFSAFVVDGRRGVRHLLEKRYPGTLIQFCQFHQIQIIKRYIPQRAKTEAAQQLRSLALTLSHTSRTVLEHSLSLWHEEHHAFLKERTINPRTGRWQYTHRRLRSAYQSLKANLSYLFTYQDHPHLKIPNTTNHCDGLFAHIKQKVLIHRGISKSRRKKMIDYLLENF